jgi:hypothetical protein
MSKYIQLFDIIKWNSFDYLLIDFDDYLEPNVVYSISVQLFLLPVNVESMLYKNHYLDDIQSMEKKLFEVSKQNSINSIIIFLL